MSEARLLVALASAAWVAACATTSAPLPPPSAPAPAHVDLGPDPFRELDAGPPPAPAPVSVEPAPPPDPRLADEAALRALQAGTNCAAMVAGAAKPGHASAGTVRELLAAAERCQEHSKDVAAARETARALLLACGPDGVSRCRAKALGLMKRLANAKPRAPALAAHARELEKADLCATQAERAAANGAALPPCLAAADALYRAEGDALMHQRALAARALSTARTDAVAADRLYTLAAAACTAPRCASESIRVLDGQAALASKQGRLDAVLLIRLQQDRVAVEALAPERRDHARSAKVDAACAALDAAQGPGTCRALEKKTQGYWTFHDPTAHVFAGDLPKDEALRANDDYLVTLQDCFRDEATRLPIPSQVRFHLRWTITPEGRADQVHLDLPADDQGPLAGCLRERFKLWRYPRSHGELQHVEQSFTVTAHPR